jgi:nanoRNase/pAp phosphatase (c-di-AMP/oligoRNAs hydrolase)
MIEITKKDLLSQDFKVAMTKVAMCSKFEPKVAYRVMRTTKNLETCFKEVQKDFALLVKTVAKVDVKGNPVLNADKTDYEFLDSVTKEEAIKKLEAFVSDTIKVDRDRFELEQFAPAGLTPADLAILQPLINEPGD